jgi:hypothetical protein
MTRRSRRPAKPSRPATMQPLEARQFMSVTVPTAEPDVSLIAAASTGTVVGYTPAEVRTAYGFSSLSFSSGKVAATGAGQTIAIVDAYSDPNIASDLSKFDTQFGLAAAALSVVNQTGGTTLPSANASWAEEISLDVEWAHAIAPGAKILLVETSSSSDASLLAGVNYARSASGVSVVSMSWGGSEFSGQTAYDSYFTTPSGHTGVTFVAASGDEGSSGGADWPASSPEVLSVGGTSLTVTGTSGTYSRETGWADSGGGASVYEGEPSYQSTVQSKDVRTVPDVAYDASPYTGVAVYDSYGTSTAWMEFGGTSAAAPQWGALVAIADQGRVIAGSSELDGATNLLPTLYSLASSSTTYSADFHDVTSGSSSYSISAGTGYDEVTGLGTPKAASLVPALVASTKKVALTLTVLPVSTNPGRGGPPPGGPGGPGPRFAVDQAMPAAVRNTTVTTARAASSAESINLVESTEHAAAAATVNAGTDGSAGVITASTVDGAMTAAAATDAAGATGTVFAAASDAAPAAAVDAPLGLVGANLLATAAPVAAFGFSAEHSFASLLASAWPAGTTELRVAAESFAQTLAANAVTAVKPLAIAAAAAGILCTVAGKAKKSKGIQPLFSDRLISIA